jgi:excisionase family DNA binding protein
MPRGQQLKNGAQNDDVALADVAKLAAPGNIPFAQRLTCTIAQACEVTGLGRTTLYELIGEGHISTTTVGRRRLVLVQSLLSLIESNRSPVGRTWHWASPSGRKLEDAELAQPVQLISPPTHHPHPLLPELGRMGVSCPDFVGLLMRQLTLNGLSMPLAALIQKYRGSRSQAVNGQLGLVVAEPSQRRIKSVVADWTMPGPDRWKEIF